jgi:DNA polymerase V
MSEQKIFFYNALPSISDVDVGSSSDDITRLAPSTCTEAETFVLRVLDDSMEPEFRKGCIIVIDPTGHATEGSYVLARSSASAENDAPSDDDQATLLESFLFRQLRSTEQQTWQLCALNDTYTAEATATDLSSILGVIVQRAGTRRRYHKRYD